MRDTFRNNGETLIRGDVKVEWYRSGEGLNGDYNPDDPEDIELLRFDFYRRNNVGEKGDGFCDNDGWLVPDDSSYCTQIPASTDKETLKKALVLLMDEAYDAVVNWPDSSVKKLMERLSWISLESVKTGVIERKWVL